MWPNGNTFPCCLATNDYTLGNTNNNSFIELWNSERMRDLRKNIVDGKPTSGCVRCYEHEENGAQSMRINMNRDLRHHWGRTKLTHEDGSLDEIHMAYMDIRFSNICNFKCRSCGPELSSFWVDDAVKLNRYSKTQPKIIKIKNTLDELWEDMEQWIDTVENIYFAGGEPLIMDEHYKILEHLIAIGKTDIFISYNTNFSKLKYKNKDVVELWKHFKYVKVGASLDAMDERAEYMRSGTNWEDIEKNIARIKEEVPHVSFQISSTISIYNAEHCLDFFDKWIYNEWVDPMNISINLLLFPEYLRAHVLPEHKRKLIKAKIKDYISKHDLENIDSLNRSTSGLKAFSSFLDEDKSDLIPKFIEYNNSLDEIRNEKLIDVFPELKELYT